MHGATDGLGSPYSGVSALRSQTTAAKASDSLRAKSDSATGIMRHARAMRVWFALSLVLSGAGAAVAGPMPIERSRIVIVDGDTVRIDGVLMRVSGCDAPETREARCDPGANGASGPQNALAPSSIAARLRST
jgi:endonuclease YncB( thermonuclease family)